MHSVGVRDHFMIAHSFQGEVFGPAQKLHGATYIVDCEFRRPTLAEGNIVVDIGRASEALKAILAELNYRNLDEVPQLKGINTTTEFLARHVFDRMREAIRAGRLGPGAEGVTSMKVTLWESHVAWAAYEEKV
ncbi:6-pyruvoyl trahydropterin synthase family protein [Benzoatithermus flavus]|uniref:6-carboxy-5,6,7,8-tetrahydropterin synthase n=1 Tax=Benzoatithermus flavus TaxID=3108223 RepID=A0ABU8XVK0_9PROT